LGSVRALERVAIGGFRWHHLRHTSASGHSAERHAAVDLQQTGGWESPEVIRRSVRPASDLSRRAHGD